MCADIQLLLPWPISSKLSVQGRKKAEEELDSTLAPEANLLISYEESGLGILFNSVNEHHFTFLEVQMSLIITECCGQAAELIFHMSVT